LAKISHVVFELRKWTDRQTETYSSQYTSLPIPKGAKHQLAEMASDLGHGYDGCLGSASNGSNLTHEMTLVVRLFRLSENVDLSVDLLTAIAAFPAITTKQS